ncbi:hypothetical protein [Kribbella sp. NPDC050469]|uniref:hypothetical protein n=1 Tax=Kribbella sp. NPDC050469 TaxID=3364116 RepID=UPI003797E63B
MSNGMILRLLGVDGVIIVATIRAAAYEQVKPQGTTGLPCRSSATAVHARTEAAFPAAAATVAKILREWSSITRTIATPASQPSTTSR